MLARVTFLSLLTLAAAAEAAKRDKPHVIANLSSLYDGLSPSVVIIYPEIPGARGIGSGVVLHRDGFIATAAHVVDRAFRIEVEFKDGSKTDAQIVTLSRSEDIALIKVEKLPAGTFVPALGDSDELQVGDQVFVIGAPLGLKHTLTTGIVSAVRADFGSELAFLPKNVIQTDAAINQGNSGGALFNHLGQVVGITSFMATPTGGNVGLGFAIPSNTVRRRLFDNAIPWMGMVLRRVPEPMAEVLNWSARDALLVEHVLPGTPAAEAGFKGGDVEAWIGGIRLMLGGDLIVGVGEVEIGKAAEVHALLHDLKAGDAVVYSVIRSGEELKLEVKVERIIPPPTLAGGPPPAKAKAKKR